MMYALWALAGWCGTPYPGWWRGPRPKPDPEPWWLVKVVAIIGGVLGGWLVERMFPATDVGPALVAATTLGALVVGRFAGDIASMAFGGARAADVGSS